MHSPVSQPLLTDFLSQSPSVTSLSFSIDLAVTYYHIFSHIFFLSFSLSAECMVLGQRLPILLLPFCCLESIFWSVAALKGRSALSLCSQKQGQEEGSEVFEGKPDDLWVPRTHTVERDQTPNNCPLNSTGVPQCIHTTWSKYDVMTTISIIKNKASLLSMS